MERLRRLILLLFFSLFFITIYAQQEKANRAIKQENSLYDYVENFINSVPQHTDSLIAAVDYSIAFAKDSTVKSQIAGYLFNKFSTSGIMGQESVAIYISKNYFLNGLLTWQGQGGIELLKFYTEFNEHSLIGMQAPQLNLKSTNGNNLPLTSLKNRYTIIYFFDKECSACKEGLPELKEIVRTYSHLSLGVYAVYANNDSSGLSKFISNNFKNQELNNWHFAYDPTMESNFHKLYNVIATPRIFLLDRDKKIIGRNLNNSTLKELLNQEQSSISKSFKLAQEFIEGYLSIFDLKDTTEVKEAFEPLFIRLSNENLDMYNAVFYQLFEYLSTQQEQYMKNAALFLANNYILPYKELWFDNWFIETRVPKVRDRIINNSIGAKLPTPTLYTHKERKKAIKANKYKYTYLYFFNTDCAICKPFSYEIKNIYKELKRNNVQVIAIYTGTNREQLKEYLKEFKPPWKVLYQGSNSQTPLHNIFEIEFVPQTYLLNRDGIIIAKTINTIQLLKLLK